MKNIILIALVLILNIKLYGQKKFTKTNKILENEMNQKLQEKNGFQDLKLGSDISNYTGFIPRNQLEYPDEQYYNLYDLVYQGDKYQNIGDTKIKYVHIKLFGNLIQEIMVTCKYDDFLLGAFMKMYGTNRWSHFTELNNGKCGINMYWWESKDVKVEFSSYKWYNEYDELPGFPNSNRIYFLSKKIQQQRKKIRDDKIENKYKKAQNDF